MKNLLKGPLPASAFYLVLILLFAGDILAFQFDGAPAGSWWLSGWLRELAWKMGGGAEDQGVAILGALLLATLGGLLQCLVQAWTGNRIVALFAGAFLVLHTGKAYARWDAVLMLLPACFVLAALLFRQRADSRPHEDGSPLLLEGAALICVALAGFSGPAVAALPFLSVLTAAVFQQGHERSAFLSRLLPRFGADALIVAAFCVNASGTPAAFPAGPAMGWSQLLGLFRGAALAPLADVIGIALACAGSAALVVGLVTLRSHPRWLLLHFGMGTVWFLVCWIIDWLPGMPPGSWGRTLGLCGPALALGSLGWRAAMGMWARSRAWSAPGASEPGAPGLDREALDSELEARLPPLVAREVARELRERRASRSAACRVPPQWEAAWQQRRLAWQERFLAENGKSLGESWSVEEQQRNLLAAYVLPHAATDARALLLGPVPGTLVRDLAPHVFQLSVAGGGVERLAGLARDVADLENVSVVRTAGSGLATLAAGSLDVVLSTQAFLHLDQEDVYRHLLELARVLRPAGCAILAFADLGDPLGREAFERQVAVGAPSGEPLRFVTRDEVRELVAAAGLSLDSLHLAATGRDFLAVIRQDT